jgi:hypothetical protein
MEIKEPAAIFSEEGLKMFINALKGSTPDIPTENEVDKLVKEYNEYHKRKKGNAHEEKMENLMEHLTVFFEDGEIKTSEDIMKYLNENCGMKYDLRSINPLMRGAMHRDPNFQKLSKREYQYQVGLKLDE